MFLRAVEHPERVCLVMVKHVGKIECDLGSLREISVEGALGFDWFWTWKASLADRSCWTELVSCDAIIGVEEYHPKEPAE